MSAARPQFSIDDAFELSLEDAGPGPESSGVARFGPLHFERRARFEVADEDKQSRLRYQNLENDEDGAQASPEPDGGISTSSQWSFSTISNSTQRSYNACCSADPGRRGTGGGPLSRCLQRRLLRARLPGAGPGSLPRDLHLLRGQRAPGLPVLLPALLREVRLPASARGGSSRPSGGLLGARPVSSFISRQKPHQDPRSPQPYREFAQEVGRVPALGLLPGPGQVALRLLGALTYSRAPGLLGCG